MDVGGVHVLQSDYQGTARVMSIGSAIKIVRQAREMKLGEVAEASSITAAFLSLIESGSRLPSDDVLQKIAAALGVSVEVLRVQKTTSIACSEIEDSQSRKLAESIRKISEAEANLKKWLQEGEL